LHHLLSTRTNKSPATYPTAQTYFASTAATIPNRH
jgi:hypothetical protein